MVWDAFEVTEWSKIIVDLCGNDPAYGGVFGVLLPGCCDFDNDLGADDVTVTDRNLGVPGCCLDDPPGYDPNFKVVWNCVAPGIWYHPLPVNEDENSWGDYTLNITSEICDDNFDAPA